MPIQICKVIKLTVMQHSSDTNNSRVRREVVDYVTLQFSDVNISCSRYPFSLKSFSCDSELGSSSIRSTSRVDGMDHSTHYSGLCRCECDHGAKQKCYRHRRLHCSMHGCNTLKKNCHRKTSVTKLFFKTVRTNMNKSSSVSIYRYL